MQGMIFGVTAFLWAGAAGAADLDELASKGVKQTVAEMREFIEKSEGAGIAGRALGGGKEALSLHGVSPDGRRLRLTIDLGPETQIGWGEPGFHDAGIEVDGLGLEAALDAFLKASESVRAGGGASGPDPAKGRVGLCDRSGAAQGRPHPHGDMAAP